MTLALRALACATLGFALSCSESGGGGGGGGTVSGAPRLVSVALISSQANPVPGDALLLVFDRDVEVVPTARFDDEDAMLSTGSLGTAVADPVRTQPFTIRVELGVGVNFVPGATTLQIGPDCDSIRTLGGGRLATDDGRTRVILPADGEAPTIDRITAEALPTELDGTGDAGGMLQIPRSSVQLQALFTDASQTTPPAAVILTVDGTVTRQDGTQREAGTDISDLLTQESADANQITWTVPADVFLPIGTRTLSAIVIDASGRPSDPQSFAVLSVSASNDLRPFESGQVWFISLDRDIESFRVDANQFGGSSVTILPGASGEFDFFEMLEIAGLRSASPIGDIGDGRDSNTAAWDLLRQAFLDRLRGLYAGTSVTFTFDAPGTFPAGRDFVAYEAATFSQICLGGAADTSASGVLGAALVDPRNTSHEDNCNANFGGVRLGVFAHTPINLGLETRDLGFRAAFRAVMPALSGNPIGSQTGDDARLLGTLSDARRDAFDDAFSWLANILAVVMAHECGHSVGLVANGPMPRGLYGDDPFNFPLSGGQPFSNANTHIENQSLFTAPAINVMSAAIDLDAPQSADTIFNPLNMAYLRERVLYDER